MLNDDKSYKQNKAFNIYITEQLKGIMVADIYIWKCLINTFFGHIIWIDPSRMYKQIFEKIFNLKSQGDQDDGCPNRNRLWERLVKEKRELRGRGWTDERKA